MPVHEKHYIANNPADLVTDVPKTGLAGAASGILAPRGQSPPAERAIGEYHAMDAPTGVSAADSATAGAVDVSFTAPTGASKCDILVREAATKRFVKRFDTGNTASPKTVTGLTAGTEYEFRVRGVTADGKVGPFSAAATATPV